MKRMVIMLMVTLSLVTTMTLTVEDKAGWLFTNCNRRCKDRGWASGSKYVDQGTGWKLCECINAAGDRYKHIPRKDYIN